MSSPHSAFCTKRALLSDLQTLGYKHHGDDINSNTDIDIDILDESILRYLIAVIDPFAMVGELNMNKFFATSGLKTCTPKSSAKAKACFLRALIDLAASSRARRDVATELDFDIDAYGVFTPEDISADNELALLIKHREELFPTRTKKRARTPLARKDANIRNNNSNNNNNRKPSRKPPLPQAAKKSSHDKTLSSASLVTTEEPVSFSKLSTVELIREAKKRAAGAAKIAADDDIEVPPVPKPSRQLSDLGFIPAIVDSVEFFAGTPATAAHDDEDSDTDKDNENPTVLEQTDRGMAATTDDDDGKTNEDAENTHDVKHTAASVTENVKGSITDDTPEEKVRSTHVGSKKQEKSYPPTELDKDPASDDGSIIEPNLRVQGQLTEVSSEATVSIGSAISPDTSSSEVPVISNVSAAEAAAAVALRTEIDLLTTEAAEALAAVKAFEASAAPLLQISRHSNARCDTYDADLDDELSASVLEAHQAQRKLLQELRSHIKIDQSYEKLQSWASKASVATSNMEYCRQRAENAQVFSERLERIDD